MLTFKQKFLDAIRAGKKTQTLRMWKTLRIHENQKNFIPGVGPIFIDEVEEVCFEDLTDADAIPDGFDSLAKLKTELENIYGENPDGKLYRIRFHLLAPSEKEKKEKTPPQIPSQESNSVLNPLFPGVSCKPITLEPHGPLPFYEGMTILKKEVPQFSEAQTVEKMIRRCRINRNVCDWNHEPGKSQDFFSLFMQSPRNDEGIPTLDGYRLRSLMRDQLTEEQWEEICMIAADVCSAWTEWQYAIEQWFRFFKKLTDAKKN